MLEYFAPDFDLFISPSSHDSHHLHESVGRATKRAIKNSSGPVCWNWGLWADLASPNLIYGFNDDLMTKILTSLSCHSGEINRNDYRRLVFGRAEANSILGPERVFGFGSDGIDYQFAEVVRETRVKDEKWIVSPPRFLDPANPLDV